MLFKVFLTERRKNETSHWFCCIKMKKMMRDGNGNDAKSARTNKTIIDMIMIDGLIVLVRFLCQCSMQMFNQKKKAPVVLAVASSGGHWVQLQRIAPAFNGAEVHYATTDATAAEQVQQARVHVYPDANQQTPIRLMRCALRMAWIVFRLRPQVVVSTGAAGGFLAIWMARFFGARTMFIDSIANARKLSISARMSLGVADMVLSQWRHVAQASGADYRGAVI